MHEEQKILEIKWIVPSLGKEGNRRNLRHVLELIGSKHWKFQYNPNQIIFCRCMFFFFRLILEYKLGPMVWVSSNYFQKKLMLIRLNYYSNNSLLEYCLLDHKNKYGVQNGSLLNFNLILFSFIIFGIYN